MREALLLTAAVAACLAGMGWLALAMDVHWRQVRGGDIVPAAARRLRMLGAAGLSVALVLCLMADHATMAALVWVMALAVSALAVALALSWKPRLLRALAWAGGRG